VIRLLCDQSVAGKYVQAFDGLGGSVVTTVADELAPDASDDTAPSRVSNSERSGQSLRTGDSFILTSRKTNLNEG